MKALGVEVTHSQGSELSVPSPYWPGPPRRAGDAEGRTPPPRVTAEPPAWDICAASLGHEEKEAPHPGHRVLTEGLTRGPQPSGDHYAEPGTWGEASGWAQGGRPGPRVAGSRRRAWGPVQAPPAVLSAQDAPWVPAPQAPGPAQPGHRTYSRSRFPEKSNVPLCGSWRFHGT